MTTITGQLTPEIIKEIRAMEQYGDQPCIEITTPTSSVHLSAESDGWGGFVLQGYHKHAEETNVSSHAWINKDGTFRRFEHCQIIQFDGFTIDVTDPEELYFRGNVCLSLQPSEDAFQPNGKDNLEGENREVGHVLFHTGKDAFETEELDHHDWTKLVREIFGETIKESTLYNQPLFDRNGAIVHEEIDLTTARIVENPEGEEDEDTE